jgi:hypothetical protein
VTFINTDGMAFIGPGSEWLWTALSGIVLAVTFLAIYRQLRLQASANSLAQMDSIDREWQSETMMRGRLAILLLRRDGGELSKGFRATAVVGDYFERVAYLVRSGSIHRRLAYEYVGSSVRSWWAFCAPMTQAIREAQSEPTAYEHFEWLAGIMAEMDAKRGIVNPRDQTWLDRTIQGAIDGNLEAIRLAEELRAIVFRPMSRSPVTPDLAGGEEATPAAQG